MADPVPPNQPDTQPLPSAIDQVALHTEAERRLQEAVVTYGALLIRQARILAVKDQANDVQAVHVERAKHVLGDSENKTFRRELLILFGGALFGAFLQGFTDAVTEQQVRALKVAIYTAFGLFGLSLALWGLFKR